MHAPTNLPHGPDLLNESLYFMSPGAVACIFHLQSHLLSRLCQTVLCPSFFPTSFRGGGVTHGVKLGLGLQKADCKKDSTSFCSRKRQKASLFPVLSSATKECFVCVVGQDDIIQSQCAGSWGLQFSPLWGQASSLSKPTKPKSWNCLLGIRMPP